MDVNPFESVIVSEPRRIDTPVAGLNETPLGSLAGQFEKLVGEELPRSVKLSGAQLVQSPAPGYGKSHLIGRLFKRLSGRATLIYLRPYTNSSACWRSILLKTVLELEFPESAAAEFCGEQEANQLEALVHGILVNVALNGIADGAIKVRDRRQEAALGFFRKVSLKELRAKKHWVGWVFEKKVGLAELMERQLKQRGIFLNASPLAWLSVLVRYAYRPKDYELRQACLDWLRGGSVDDAEAERIGIPPADRPGHDLPIEALNSAAKERIADFCGLAGFFRPFVFCFDQTENYGAEAGLAKSLGIVIQGLVDDCPNHMTVVTANQDPWHKVVQRHWEEAHKDRLARPALELSGLNLRQAEDLVRIRIEGWPSTASAPGRRLGSDWLGEIFGEAKEVGVRHFLVMCSARWRAAPAPPGLTPAKRPTAPTVEALYRACLNKIKSQPKRLVFDPDALFWLVQEVGCRPGVATHKFKSLKGYLAVRWEVEGRKIYFGFEPGHHFKRWEAITKEAERYHAGDPAGKTVFFRTPELQPIPGPGWKIAPAIAAATARYLHIVVLGHEEMAELYAAFDLYMGAVEGDVPVAPAAVIEFVRQRLAPFWGRILEPKPENWSGGRGGPAEAPPLGAPETGLVRKIRNIVKREKFMSMADLLAKISPPVSEEELHRARACIPEIQVHTGPSMTVLQWRPGK